MDTNEYFANQYFKLLELIQHEYDFAKFNREVHALFILVSRSFRRYGTLNKENRNPVINEERSQQWLFSFIFERRIKNES